MSAFTNECWRLAGRQNAVDPKGLEELFQTFEMERERLAKLEALHKDALGEMASVYNELHVARKDLELFQNRESVHIQPLLTAMLEHLRFPDAPSAQGKAVLRERVERAQQFKVARGSAFTETGDAMAELEKKRGENGMLAARVEALEKELHEQVVARQLDESTSAKRLSALTADLEGVRGANAVLRKAVSDLENDIRHRELERAELVRVTAANRELIEAIGAWRLKIA